MDVVDDRQRDVGAGDSLRAPDVRLQPPRRSTGRQSIAVLAALGLHALGLAAVLVAFDAPLGLRDGAADIVEVSLVGSDALRSEAAGHSAIVTGGVNLGDRPGGGADADAAAGGAPAPIEKPAEVSPPADETKLVLAPSPDGDMAAAQPKSVQPAASSAGTPADTDAAAVAGGASIIAAETVRETAAAPSATEGEINAYNQRVAVALSKLKPKGIGEAGLARVQFRIDSRGAVDDIKLASSTGKSKLDRLATETVARAKFDVPPAGMTSVQLTYAVAFRFR